MSFRQHAQKDPVVVPTSTYCFSGGRICREQWHHLHSIPRVLEPTEVNQWTMYLRSSHAFELCGTNGTVVFADNTFHINQIMNTTTNLLNCNVETPRRSDLVDQRTILAVSQHYRRVSKSAHLLALWRDQRGLFEAWEAILTATVSAELFLSFITRPFSLCKMLTVRNDPQGRHGTLRTITTATTPGRPDNHHVLQLDQSLRRWTEHHPASVLGHVCFLQPERHHGQHARQRN